MRFVCDSCRAQYMISDDKVGAKGVKVRCKKCDHVILVRKPEAGAESSEESSRRAGASSDDAMAAAEVPAARNGAAQADALLGNVEDDEIGAVFDQVLNKAAPSAASEPASDDGGSGSDDLESTRVVSLDALKRMAEDAESQARPAGGSGKPDSTDKVPTTDWYVAVREEQVGPLTLERVKELWDRGEVGAESLCWRAGFADWIPLSEVKDLKAVLAPRPAKPVIVAPAAVMAPSPAPGPVESAFTAGSSPYAPSKSAPAPQAAASSPADAGAWTPSAASALASLAQQEVESFSKPAPRPVAAPEPMAAATGLLDLPPPEPAPVAAPQPRNTFSQLPAMDEPEPPRARPQSNGYGSAPAPYPQPTYDAYRPPAPQPPPPVQPSGNRNALIGVVGAIGLAVIVGLVVVVVLRPTAPATQQPEPIARVQPAPVQPSPAVVQQPAPAQPAPTVVAQPTPSQPVAAAPAPTPTVVAPPVPTQPAPVAPTPVQPAPTPSTAEVAKADSSRTERDSSSTKRTGKHSTSSSDRGSSSRSETVASNDPPPTKRSSSSSSGGGDDFDKEFGSDSGSSSSKSSSKSSDSGSKKGGYIPPAPGSGDVPDKLGNSDVMQVVKLHIPELKTCTSEQKRKNPDLSGTLVMRWTIMPSGRTTSVQVRSDQFKSTYIAGCISGLVKSWSFPKHRVQGDPIDFPFNF